MGAQMWEHIVPYQDDMQKALDELKREEFEAGRFRLSATGPEPTTPEEALELAGDVGTCSVLDMLFVSERADYLTVSPVSLKQLIALFGTDKPTRRDVISSLDISKIIENGQGIFIIIYDNRKPSEIYFAGYSF